MEAEVSKLIEEFWQGFLQGLPENDAHPEGYEAWGFGSSPRSADELAALTLDGTKRATCSLLWEYEHDGDVLPQVGEYSVVLAGSGRPVCVIETIEVVIRPFRDVDARFAHDEGEGDRTLESWREGHWQFFSSVCERIGRSVDETMPLVCERFRVVHPLAPRSD